MVVLLTAAGSNQNFILGFIEHDCLGRTFCHADPARLAIPDINRGNTFRIYLGNLPWTYPYTGKAGYAFIAFNPGSFSFIKDILVGYIPLLICHIPESLHDLGETDVLRAYKNTAFALGAEPEQVRLQQPVLQAHAHHMDDLAGIKVRDCLADRTDTAAGTTGKAAVEVLAALLFGYFSIKGRGDFLGRHRHKKPLFLIIYNS
jgi:hypothetical protein